MRHRFLLATFLGLASGYFAGCGTPATTAADSTPTQSEKKPEPVMPFPTLEKGTTAANVRAKLGEPFSIEPMPSPTGKAEVWTYNYEMDLGMAQVATGTRDIQVMSVGLAGPQMITVKEPVYTLARKKAEVTLSLLMFDDRLEVQKAKIAESEDHH